MKKFLSFLEELEAHNIYYILDKIRDDYVRVDVSVPGERWEVEFAADGDLVIERFQSLRDLEGRKVRECYFPSLTYDECILIL